MDSHSPQVASPDSPAHAPFSVKRRRRRWPWVLLVIIFTVAGATALTLHQLGVERALKIVGLESLVKPQRDPNAPPPTGLRLDDPITIPAIIRGDDWLLTIHSVDLDASGQLQEFSEHNLPPEESETYVLINYTLQYTGPKPEGALPTFKLDFITSEQRIYTTTSKFLLTPDALDRRVPILPGESVTANSAIAVQTAAPEDGLLRVDVQVSMGHVYVSLK